MKSKQIYLALLVCFLAGIGLVGKVLVQQEEKQEKARLLGQGNNLASLIALHSIDDFRGEKGHYILRTIREYVCMDGLVYCLIHDGTGGLVASLGPRDLVAQIPREVRTQSLFSLGLTTQSFRIKGSGLTIYEFAKPVFENGQRSGTVRLGFELARPPLFSPERIRLLAMIALIVFFVAAFVYYGIILALRRLNTLSASLRSAFLEGAPQGGSDPGEGARVDQIIQGFEQSLGLLKQRLKEIEATNIELETRAGMQAFYEKQLRNILDAMRLGILVTDSQDHIVQVNVTMLSLLNKKRDEMLDRPIQEAVEHDGILAFLGRHAPEGEEGCGSGYETTFPGTAPGRLFLVSLSLLRDFEGGVTGKMILVEDVTNERLAEKAKQEFVAHVTHELYTPLTTIRSYNEMLMVGEVQDEETQREFYNTIMEETDRLKRLIENLLNISKIEMGSLTLDRGLVKTDSLVRDCIAAVETSARKKHITIERDLPDNFPVLVGDKELLKVALINVLGNAVKYTPEYGKVSLSLTENGGAAVFTVEDTGYGISEQDLPHIFDKFYRSRDPRIAGETGSGLGLGIASEIVHLHGGDIQVESEPGKGTHFELRIPKEDVQLGAAEPKDPCHR